MVVVRAVTPGDSARGGRSVVVGDAASNIAVEEEEEYAAAAEAVRTPAPLLLLISSSLDSELCRMAEDEWVAVVL